MAPTATPATAPASAPELPSIAKPRASPNAAMTAFSQFGMMPKRISVQVSQPQATRSSMKKTVIVRFGVGDHRSWARDRRDDDRWTMRRRLVQRPRAAPLISSSRSPGSQMHHVPGRRLQRRADLAAIHGHAGQAATGFTRSGASLVLIRLQIVMSQLHAPRPPRACRSRARRA